MKLARPLFLASILCLFALPAAAQETFVSDTTIIFEPVRPDFFTKSPYQPLRNAWGVDLMVSNNGFGGGVFFRRQYTENTAGFISFAISDVKDEGEVEFFNQFTGETFIPGKKNRLLLFPLMVGVQYRLFADDIVESFRPFVSAGIGPSMVFVAPYSRTHTVPVPGGGTFTYYEQIEFFSSLKFGQAKYTLGGFVGGGAHFGIDRGTLSGITFRYYHIPFRNGIEILEGVPVKSFGGFFITLNFGSFF
jgi:hypothetical protein